MKDPVSVPTLIKLEAVLMPQGEIICNGSTIGWQKDLGKFLAVPSPKTNPTFEDWLEEKYMEVYPSTLDDDLPDAVSDWIGNLDADELITYAQEWGSLLIK